MDQIYQLLIDSKRKSLLIYKTRESIMWDFVYIVASVINSQLFLTEHDLLLVLHGQLSYTS
jgi:hypothetical protein